MTDYQPGRIYSGMYNYERELFLCDRSLFVGIGKAVDPQTLTDIRGPLVVLDVLDMTPGEWADVARDLRADAPEGEGPYAWIADEIEEQTRPPLQIGWHEVKTVPPKYWDGNAWCWRPGESPMPNQNLYKSVHFIGPGSQS